MFYRRNAIGNDNDDNDDDNESSYYLIICKRLTYLYEYIMVSLKFKNI
jgi:hypothetical protein